MKLIDAFNGVPELKKLTSPSIMLTHNGYISEEVTFNVAEKRVSTLISFNPIYGFRLAFSTAVVGKGSHAYARWDNTQSSGNLEVGVDIVFVSRGDLSAEDQMKSNKIQHLIAAQTYELMEQLANSPNFIQTISSSCEPSENSFECGKPEREND